MNPSARLYVQGVISREEALFRADDKSQMKSFFQS